MIEVRTGSPSRPAAEYSVTQKMTLPEFDIYPYVGPLPLRYGMPREDVASCLGVAPRPSKNDDYFGSVRVGFGGGIDMAEAGFVPRDVTLSFLGKRLWDRDQILDPMPVLLRHDPTPVEFYGFIIFTKIGVTCTGFHDDDPAQRAITVFRRGLWDKHLPKAKEPDLERYRL